MKRNLLQNYQWLPFMQRCKSLLVLMLITTISAYAQNIVTGTVTSSEGETLPGVNVLVSGSDQGTITNIDGEYRIQAAPNATLVFSFVGYLSEEELVNQRSVVDVVLMPDIQQLGEVVVIGYGEQSRETLTSSVSKLDNNVLENVSYANTASALQGNIPGLRVQSVSGQPGASPRIILRGGTSINNPDGSTPLYVVNGVIRDDIDYINPNDIESIQVLKDAASTAIYGARASNGVVIVETKSGAAGQIKVDYNYRLTQSEVGKTYDLASPSDFVYYMRLGIAASGERTPSVLNFLNQANAGGIGNDLTNDTRFTTMLLSPENEYLLDLPADQWGAVWETIQDPLDPTQTLIFKGMDFQETIFKRAYTNDHSLNISGGSEQANFNLGLGYLDNEGTTINTDFKRLTLNLDGVINVTDKLSFNGGIVYANIQDTQVPNTGVVFKNNINTAQTSKYQYEDGSLAPGRLFTNGNPAYYISRYDSKRERDNYMIFAGAEWELFPGLSFKPKISLVNDNFYDRNFLMAYENGVGTYVENRQASVTQTTSHQYQADAVFQYYKNFGLHDFDVVGGYSYYNYLNRFTSASGRYAATDLIPTLNASATPWAVSGEETEQLLYGYFGRLNYNYDLKYLLSLSARYDGASNLGDDKWGFFPGISTGWNIHRENFWNPNVYLLTTLKLRASYGVNGNISGLGPYEAQGEYSVGSRYYGGAAIYNSNLANKELQWERSKTMNLGLDFGLFNDRVTGIVDVYERITENLLTNQSLPSSTGFSSILTNLGSLKNRGLEASVAVQVLPIDSEFQWNLTLNAGYVNTEIVELPENGQENNRIGGILVWDEGAEDYVYKGGLQEGGQIGDLYGYVQESIYATDEEAEAGPVDMLVIGDDKTKGGGDVNWRDVDGNGIIDETDRVYMGNIYPDWTGGIRNSFNYKNLGLTIALDYTLGHTIYNETAARVLGNFSGQNAIGADITRSWEEQGDVTDIPRYYWADQNQKQNLRRGNSRFYQSGDFLCIREVSLVYSLPQEISENLRMSNVRFNLTANNLYYFTDFGGLNPEEGGTDNGRYPNPRNITFGVKISPSF